MHAHTRRRQDSRAHGRAPVRGALRGEMDHTPGMQVSVCHGEETGPDEAEGVAAGAWGSRQEGALKVASEWKLHGEHELDQSAQRPPGSGVRLRRRPAGQTKGAPCWAGRSAHEGLTLKTRWKAGASVHMVPFVLNLVSIEFCHQVS